MLKKIFIFDFNSRGTYIIYLNLSTRLYILFNCCIHQHVLCTVNIKKKKIPPVKMVFKTYYIFKN